jgi:hypothetical protein
MDKKDKKEKKVREPSALQKLLGELNLTETNTKVIQKPKKFTKVKDQIPNIANYNFGADILMLPESKKTKNRYCLVVTDLATNAFDIEGMPNKEATTTLKAMEKMFKRKHIKKPEASITTDGGNEFKSEFQNYMFENSILHKTAAKGRHTQNANVENLNRTLGRIFNLYMNGVEEKTGKVYTNWDDMIDEVRTKLNEIRKRPEGDPYTDPMKIPTDFTEPKFNVGDIVFQQLDVPQNALGHELSGKFREGDSRWSKIPRKIKIVTVYAGAEKFRYILDGIPNVSYTEAQLKLAPKTETESKYVVEKIVDKKTVNKKVQYFIKWKGYKATENTWEPKETLIEDGLQSMIDEFEKNKKKK